MWHLAYTATSLTVGEVVYARGSVTSLGGGWPKAHFEAFPKRKKEFCRNAGKKKKHARTGDNAATSETSDNERVAHGKEKEHLCNMASLPPGYAH